MSPASTMVGLRLDAEQLGRLDAYIARAQKETGLRVTRGAAARSLVILGLDAAEARRASDRKR